MLSVGCSQRPTQIDLDFQIIFGQFQLKNE